MAQYLGYDPGGNGAHGVAVLEVVEGRPTRAAVAVVAYADDVLSWFQARLQGRQPAGLGMDTLTLLHTGHSGWRPADRWLQATYPAVAGSVASPNSLYGAMSLNGITVATTMIALHPKMVVTETHPKLLYFALTGTAYNFAAGAPQMKADLLGWIGAAPSAVTGSLGVEHAWDALISAYAVLCGMSGAWPLDLHTLPVPAAGGQANDLRQAVWPFGPTSYFWPLVPGGSGGPRGE